MADLQTSFDTTSGDLKCHSGVDLKITPQGDFALTKNNQHALRQRFILYMLTPQGERLNPAIGCCVHDVIHDVNSVHITRWLELHIADDFRLQFPDIKVKYIRCLPSSYMQGEMKINVITADDTLSFLFTSEELLNLSSVLSELMFFSAGD